MHFACQKALSIYEKEGLIGAHMPTCDGSGNYAPKQCQISARTCWCATPDGNQVANTKSYFEDPSLINQMICTPDGNGSFTSNFHGKGKMSMLSGQLTGCRYVRNSTRSTRRN